MRAQPPVIGITGWKNSGKTTLAERLIGELAARGYKVASLKHAHHGFEVDVPGTDSHRHRMAGAAETAVASAARWAVMGELRGEKEPAMDEMIARLGPCDIVIVEGYKREGHPKIECRRAEARQHEPLTRAGVNVVAIATDTGQAAASTNPDALPVFHLDDIGAIADFAAARCALAAPQPAGTAAS